MNRKATHGALEVTIPVWAYEVGAAAACVIGMVTVDFWVWWKHRPAIREERKERRE
jgi:hypothetical protein